MERECLSVVMPVYNEKKTVLEIIDKVLKLGILKELVVVDDGSSDGTRELLAKSQFGGKVKKFYHERNLGKGAAVRTGFKHATGEIVAVQDADSGEVILVAYTNEQAFREALRRRMLVLWSTSRGELWEKGKTSGETFELLEAFVNCEQNSLLYKVRPRHGRICHTTNQQASPRNCFYRRINLETSALENLDP